MTITSSKLRYPTPSPVTGGAITPECAAELHDVRESVMADYRLSPALVRDCSAEIKRSCMAQESRTIHCLMDLARRSGAAKEEIMSDPCARSVSGNNENGAFILIKLFTHSECNTYNMRAKPMCQSNRSSYSLSRSLLYKLVNSLVLRPESRRDLGIVNNCEIVPIAIDSKRASQYS